MAQRGHDETAAPGLLGTLSFSEPGLADDPYPVYAQLRAERPVVVGQFENGDGPGRGAISRHAMPRSHAW
jgi:hypothetical protein